MLENCITNLQHNYLLTIQVNPMNMCNPYRLQSYLQSLPVLRITPCLARHGRYVLTQSHRGAKMLTWHFLSE